MHRQQVLTHPGANLSVGHGDAGASPAAAGQVEARLNGVAGRLTTCVLVGRGWTVAAMTRPGGLRAFVTEPASVFNDRVVPLGDALGIDEIQLLRQIDAQGDQEARVAVLAGVLKDAVAAADPRRVCRARRVAEVARLAETDPTLRRLSDLADSADVSPRSLQRMFMEHAGVSPTAVLRRYRLLDAAEEARKGRSVSWVKVAADLGYADQAHLIRDFRSAVGQTPAAYARSVSLLERDNR